MKKSCYEFKIELFTSTKIWNDDIDDDIGDTRPLMPIKNTLNIEKNDLQNDFIIQSCNTLDHKTQNFDDGFTISSNSMIMNELKQQNMLRQLDKEQRLIFDDIMYLKKS